MAVVNCETYNVSINEKWSELTKLINQKDYSRIGVLVDENTATSCLPNFIENLEIVDLRVIQIKSGEINKNLDTCQHIWNEMLSNGFDRHSLLINLGGGVIGDMGGFCACTFMRGMDFIQVPTTLLSQVDASVGGKLGIDFNDYKNLIGVISDPIAVWIDDSFLETLEPRQIRSGYAEIIKHAIIQDADMWQEVKAIQNLDGIDWADIINRSIRIKRDVVVQDKYEGGLRKILNFGHTLGHAIESENLHSEDFLLHGEAIGIGMIMEAYISTKMCSLDKTQYQEIKSYILSIYPHYRSQVQEREKIAGKLIKDKKNRRGRLNFSLISQIGTSVWDIVPNEELIMEALSEYSNI